MIDFFDFILFNYKINKSVMKRIDKKQELKICNICNKKRSKKDVVCNVFF